MTSSSTPVTSSRSGKNASVCCSPEERPRKAGEYLDGLFSLRGKTAVITGGGGYLGSAIASGLARCGANIVLWDVRESALAEKEASLLAQCGDEISIGSVQVDLMREEEVRCAQDTTVSRFGKLDILVNACGGHSGSSRLVRTRLKDYEFVLRLNLLAGCVIPMKLFGEYWARNRLKGCIINIASMAGFVPLSGVWAYDAAKSAVINQTAAAAREFAPYGIRVNAIAPGFFLTDANRSLLTVEATGEFTARAREILSRTPFGRFGEPEELCGVAVLLAGDNASGFISGAVIPVDGAYLCNSI